MWRFQVGKQAGRGGQVHGSRSACSCVARDSSTGECLAAANSYVSSHQQKKQTCSHAWQRHTVGCLQHKVGALQRQSASPFMSFLAHGVSTIPLPCPGMSLRVPSLRQLRSLGYPVRSPCATGMAVYKHGQRCSYLGAVLHGSCHATPQCWW